MNMADVRQNRAATLGAQSLAVDSHLGEWTELDRGSGPISANTSFSIGWSLGWGMCYVHVV